MSFEPEDRHAAGRRLHNQGTIAADSSPWLTNPWGEIGGFNSAYPSPAFSPPLLTVTTTAPSHQQTGGATSPGGSSTTSASLQPLPGAQSQVVPKFDILINYDTSFGTLQTANPSLYNSVTAAINQAVGYYETEITTPATVSVVFGWGEENGTALTAGAIAQSTDAASNYSTIDYNTLRGSLIAHDSALSTELPSTNPQSGGVWDVAQGEAFALGLKSQGPGSHPTIGFVGLSSSAPFTFDPNNRAVAGEYDGIGAISHEISELLGRKDILGTSLQNGTPVYVPMDLLRFSGAGTHDYTAGPGSYFSLDNGTTDLAALADSTSAGSPDPGDWDTSVLSDSYDAAAFTGTANTISAVDLQLLNALGFSLAAGPAACFAAGTQILTTRGSVGVEALAAGDVVNTQFAGKARVRWIGHRRIDCRRHPNPRQIWPIRIMADAFAPERPSRDTFLSPDHAVMVAGMLVPIRLLANGASIRQETSWRHLHYFHVELDRHDILLANNLPAESYLDTGNRSLFDNGGVLLQLHPDLTKAAEQYRRATQSCLPLRVEPADVLPVWRALAARARMLGFAVPEPATTDDPALCIAAGSHRFSPVARRDGHYTFVLPALDDDIRLRSRFASAATTPWLHDPRQLGVRLSRITIRTPDGQDEVALDDPGLTGGWWALERDGGAMRRWTDGNAALPRLHGRAVIELWISDTLPYPLPRPAPVGRAA